MKKYLIAASALALGLGMSSVAMADDTTANGPGNDNAVSVLSNNDVLSNNTDNSDNSQDVQDNTLNLLSGNSSDDDLNGSFNEDNDNVAIASGNSDDDIVAIDASDDDVVAIGNGDNRDNTNTSNDNDTYNTTEVDVEVDVEIDASTTYEDSVVSSQTLTATVTGATFEDGLALLDAQGDLNTGDVHQENDAFRGFTGIATIAMDTSIGSANQAATNVTAGSDISFGD